MLVQRNKRKGKTIVFTIAAFIIVGLAAYVTYWYLNEQHIIQVTRAQQQAEAAEIARLEAIAAAKEAKKKEPVYITLPGAQKIRAIVDDYGNDESIWVLASKTHAISTEYIPTKLKIPDVKTRTDKSEAERSVREDIETPLKDMFAAAESDGFYLMIGSGYRSAALQATYFNSLANSVGEEVANQTIARPGQSEHQTGLAVDITAVSRECYLQECFESTGDGRWLSENSYKYGFILRYPKGKEDITGYSYEPWHFRHVGVDLATAIHDSGLTFDEAWPYLEKALTTLKSNGAL